MTEPPALDIYIEAPAAVVFEYFVDPEAMVRWMGDHAELDPRPGGRFAVNIKGVAVRGTYLEIDPPHRLRILWGYAGGSPLPPGGSTVEIRLLAEGPGTRVSLEHRDLPPEQTADHLVGWRHYLQRLAQAAVGTQPSPDPGMPTETSLEQRAPASDLTEPPAGGAPPAVQGANL
jgi:uncharacterized protein YndB with AHSA1/START domain